jgi:hypothetical protein
MLVARRGASNPEQSSADHIIIIGTNRLSSLYIKFLRAYSPIRDHRQHLIGRAMCGVPALSSPQQLDPVIEEFAIHGIRTDRVIIGGDENFLTETALNHVRRICEQREIALNFLPDLIGTGGSTDQHVRICKSRSS